MHFWKKCIKSASKVHQYCITIASKMHKKCISNARQIHKNTEQNHNFERTNLAYPPYFKPVWTSHVRRTCWHWLYCMRRTAWSITLCFSHKGCENHDGHGFEKKQLLLTNQKPNQKPKSLIPLHVGFQRSLQHHQFWRHSPRAMHSPLPKSGSCLMPHRLKQKMMTVRTMWQK